MTRPAVLIVEDEAIIAEDLQQTLVECGCDATATATSAEEAIMRVTEHFPDVVIMDVRIRGRRDGIETACLLRDRFQLPVVFLSAHFDDETIARANQAQPYGYLRKPIHAIELRGAIELAIRGHALERRQIERERWFSTTLHAVSEAIVTVDLAGTITFLNTAAERLTGSTGSQAIGRPVGDVVRLVDEHRVGVASPLVQALAGARAVTLADVNLVNLATGASCAVSNHIVPVGEDGRTIGAVMVVRDVSAQKSLQKQLELADRLAALGTMAAGVAHEVNNPLTAVLANAACIELDLVELRSELEIAAVRLPSIVDRIDHVALSIEDIGASATRIGKIVADLKAFIRPSVGSAVRADVARALHWAIRATANEVRLRASVVTALARMPAIAGDEARLGQVLVNVLVNAAQAIEPGRADLNEIRISTRVEAGERVVIEIVDTGPGMPEHVRAQIFQPFFTTKAVGVGTGLGLSISHGIVAAMGGLLEIDSLVGKGTTVRIVLRAAPPEADVPVVAVASRPYRLRGRILVIDDEPLVLRAIQRSLSAHELVCVENGADALALLERGEQFDVILTDLAMPGMTGMDFFERVAKRSHDQAETVVFVTGGALTATSEDFLQATTNQCIEKPFTSGMLRALINQRLESHPH